MWGFLVYFSFRIVCSLLGAMFAQWMEWLYCFLCIGFGVGSQEWPAIPKPYAPGWIFKGGFAGGSWVGAALFISESKCWAHDNFQQPSRLLDDTHICTPDIALEKLDRSFYWPDQGHLAELVAESRVWGRKPPGLTSWAFSFSYGRRVWIRGSKNSCPP